MIDRTHKLSVSRQAELLDISRGTVYYLPKPVSQKDLALMNAIDELHPEFPFMGACQLHHNPVPANATRSTRCFLTCCASW